MLRANRLTTPHDAVAMVSTYAEDTSVSELHPSGRQYLPQSLDGCSPNQVLLPLTARVNEGDRLEIGGCDVPDLVEKFGSPLYILDEETVRIACRHYRDSLARYYPGETQVLYASKAWSCLAVCKLVASEGLGIDVVSGGELLTALQAGVLPDRLYLHGNNKSREELQFAVASGCTVVADNWMDLKTLVDLVAVPSEGVVSPVRVMLRFTPGIECHTHEYIRTGHLDSKFGFDPEQLLPVLEFMVQHQAQLTCVGFHAHIGSQIFELEPHNDLADVLVQWFQAGLDHGLAMQELNVGGGLGICYTEHDDPPSIDRWCQGVGEAIARACESRGLSLPRLLCEPGRSIVGPACVTAYTVGSQKTIPGLRTYLAVDGGMSDNPRPITYQSRYRAVMAGQMSAPLSTTVTVAGKHCESGDLVISDAQLPPAQPGDVLVVMGTGAYNYSMASNYNRLPRPAAVLVQGGEANIIIRRETQQDLLKYDCLPDHLRV